MEMHASVVLRRCRRRIHIEPQRIWDQYMYTIYTRCYVVELSPRSALNSKWLTYEREGFCQRNFGPTTTTMTTPTTTTMQRRRTSVHNILSHNRQRQPNAMSLCNRAILLCIVSICPPTYIHICSVFAGAGRASVVINNLPTIGSMERKMPTTTPVRFGHTVIMRSDGRDEIENERDMRSMRIARR